MARLNFVKKIRLPVDIDHNGYLDERDFACLALRATIIEGKGEFSFSRLQENQHIMLSLWEEIAELADFNKVLLQRVKLVYVCGSILRMQLVFCLLKLKMFKL